MRFIDRFIKSSKQDRRKVKKLVSGRNFDWLIMSLILFNAVVLGLMATDKMQVYGIFCSCWTGCAWRFSLLKC